MGAVGFGRADLRLRLGRQDLGSGSLQERIWGAVTVVPLGHRRRHWMHWPVGPLGRRLQRHWGIGKGQRWIRYGGRWLCNLPNRPLQEAMLFNLAGQNGNCVCQIVGWRRPRVVPSRSQFVNPAHGKAVLRSLKKVLFEILIYSFIKL